MITYFPLGMIALVAGEYPVKGYSSPWSSSGDVSSEMIYMFKKRHEIKSIYSKPAPPIPEILRFGICSAKVNDKLIVGNANSLYLYNIPSSRWFPVNRSNQFSMSRTSMCNINSNTIILVGGDGGRGDTVELIHLNKFSTEMTSYEDFSSIFSSNPNMCFENTQRSKCQTKLPIKVAFNSLINLKENTVLLTGGNNMGATSNRVFRGSLSPNGKNVLWKELSPMNIARSNHMCFRLNDAVFVAGGYGSGSDKLSCSERYDETRNAWYKDVIYGSNSNEGDLDLPFPLVDASVVIDNDQTFAALIGGTTEVMLYDTDESEDQGEHPGLEDCPNTSIIIFTVRNGFERFQNFNLLSNRKQHACLGIY